MNELPTSSCSCSDSSMKTGHRWSRKRAESSIWHRRNTALPGSRSGYISTFLTDVGNLQQFRLYFLNRYIHICHATNRNQLGSITLRSRRCLLAALDQAVASDQVFGKIAESLHSCFPHSLYLTIGINFGKRLPGLFSVSFLFLQVL